MKKSIKSTDGQEALGLKYDLANNQNTYNL